MLSISSWTGPLFGFSTLPLDHAARGWWSKLPVSRSGGLGTLKRLCGMLPCVGALYDVLLVGLSIDSGDHTIVLSFDA